MGVIDWRTISDDFKASKKAWQDEHDKIWEELPEETRLACADVVFRAIDQHAKEGGSYRTLIYDRLGFSIGGAYAVLQCSGALTLSNEYDLGQKNDL